MRHTARLVALLVAFLVGCVAARVAIPPARAGTTPQRWEYLCDSVGGFSPLEKMQQAMNKAGAEGWELVAAFGANGNAYCLKRALP